MAPRSSQAVFGLVIVLLGVGFLLDTLGLWSFGTVFSTWWPLLLIALGLSRLSGPSEDRGWGWVLVIIGVFLQLSRLDGLSFNPWSLFWPLVLIFTGLSLLRPRTGGRPLGKADGEKRVDYSVIFGGLERRVTSKEFEGGELNAVFGGIELDLREAELAEGATISAFATFGGIEIRVPHGTRVAVQGVPIFGGWSDSTDRGEKDGPLLTIHGNAIFGGVEIKN